MGFAPADFFYQQSVRLVLFHNFMDELLLQLLLAGVLAMIFYIRQLREFLKEQLNRFFTKQK